MVLSHSIGFIGTGLIVAGYVPQIGHLINERCSAGISIKAYALWCSASLLFLVHAMMIGDLVFVCVQSVNLAASGVILVFTRRYDGLVCPTHARPNVARSVP
jgi:uncharacterized protein with PQ loop repeat